MTWRARWIWDDGDLAPINAYRIFQKTFTLPDDLTGVETTARVCADTVYRLYVNGVIVGSLGPAPSAPGFFAYDEVDLKHCLGAGNNTVTVIVHHIGAPHFSYSRHRGGLLFEMGAIVSDETWLVATQSPWLPHTPRLTVQQGFTEHYDTRLEPYGKPNLWTNAVVVSPAEGGEWPILEPRGIPLADVNWHEATCLLEYGNCTPGEAETIAGQMTQEVLRPLSYGQAIREDGCEAIHIVPDGADIYLLYDFGEEVSGFLDFDVEASDGADGGIVDIGYDEALRVGETPSGLKHDWGKASDVRYADRLILAGGTENNFQNFTHRAFRYVRLAFRDLKAPVTLSIIGVYESTYPVNRRGTFVCSDARLEKIWEIGRRTLQLCMDDRFMDCPWRERAQWVGDAKIEALGAQYCFGDTRLLKRMLRQQARAQYPDGRMDPVGPGEWEAHSPGTLIPGFVCIWIDVVRDYYLLTGDSEFVAELLPMVERALAWLARCANADGLLENVPGWNFTDWAPGLSGGDGTLAPLNLQYLHALRITSELAALDGKADRAGEYARRAETLAVTFDRLFWDEARGLYRDTHQAALDAPTPTYSQQTTSLALLSHVGSEERRQRLLHALSEDKSLVQVGSPYFSYYLLAALYEYGQHEAALAYVREKWGMMLDAGATTWWEEYHGQSSRCHAWSCGPTVDLPAQFLGVWPDAPGFASVRIAPHFADLRWAKGIVPTPKGDVVVSWRRTDDLGGYVVDVSSPAGVSLRLALPGSVETINGKAVDGEPGLLLGGGYQIVGQAPEPVW